MRGWCWVRSSRLSSNAGLLRPYKALFNISLPRFVISNASFGLFASQLHFLGYVVDTLSPIFFLIKAVPRCSQVILVGGGPFCFYFFRGLNTSCLWHACWLPSGGFFRLGILHGQFSNCE